MDFYNKNILIIIHAGSLGGAERQGLSLAKILTEEYQCKVSLLLTFSRETSEEFNHYARSCHIQETFHFGEPYLVLKREWTYKNLKRLVWSSKYLWRMRKGLKPYKFDLIFPYLNFPSKIAFYMFKLLPSVKFTFWHQLGLDTFKNDHFEKYAAINIPCIIANAPNGIDLFFEAHPESKRPSFVLPQFLALDYVFKDSKILLQKYGLPENGVIVGMIAHYRKEKLHELLLSAFSEILEDNKNIYLVFLGNKNNSVTTIKIFASLQEYIKRNGLSKNVKLISEQPVYEILNVIDIGVLVSEIEGTPNIVMEYMAYGLPVVATDHPGCQLLLKNSEFLIKNDKKTLKIALSRLINSAALRDSEGERNKSLIEEYTPENYLSNLRTIMKDFE